MDDFLIYCCGISGGFLSVLNHAEWRGKTGYVCQTCANHCPVCAESGSKCAKSGSIINETTGTTGICSGENLEKSTPIQVNLDQKYVRFQCSHHRPRARRRITKFPFRRERIKGSLFR